MCGAEDEQLGAGLAKASHREVPKPLVVEELCEQTFNRAFAISEPLAAFRSAGKDHRSHPVFRFLSLLDGKRLVAFPKSA